MGFDFRKLSVLVIEDTAAMLKLVCSVMDTLGVGEYHTARDGEEGFEVFCQHNPDIIITDWDMAPIDGLEFIEMVRTDERSPNRTVPIIMVTGYAAVPRVIKARDSGTTEFIVKPFSAGDLAKRIAHVIVKPRDYVEAEEFFGPDRRRKKEEGSSELDRRGSNEVYLDEFGGNA